MEKIMPYDKEYMRMAMLKHEETFKEQVYELHRLYRIQKMLMKSIETSRPNGQNQELWNLKNELWFNKHDAQQRKLDLERPAEKYIAAESNGRDGVFEIIDESEIQLTLGPSSYNRIRRKKPKTPRTSDSGPSFSSSSTGSSHINRTREALSGDLGLVQVPDMPTRYHYQSRTKNSTIDVEEHLRQEGLKQPPWFFQVLSLNIT